MCIQMTSFDRVFRVGFREMVGIDSTYAET